MGLKTCEQLGDTTVEKNISQGSVCTWRGTWHTEKRARLFVLSCGLKGIKVKRRYSIVIQVKIKISLSINTHSSIFSHCVNIIDGLLSSPPPCNKVAYVNISVYRPHRQNNCHSGTQHGASFPLPAVIAVYHLYLQTIWGFWSLDSLQVWNFLPRLFWVLGRIQMMPWWYSGDRSTLENATLNIWQQVDDLTLLQHYRDRQQEGNADQAAVKVPDIEQTHFCSPCWSNGGQTKKSLIHFNNVDVCLPSYSYCSIKEREMHS